MKVCFALLVALWCIVGSSLEAEESSNALELRLSLSKRQIVQFEPVVLEVSVTNRSAKPQQIYNTLDLDWLYLKVFVTDSAGKEFQLGTGGISDGIPGRETIAADPANNTLRHKILLTPFPKSWMDTPGDYKLHATFDYGKDVKPLKSNTVGLKVKPTEGINKKALERFRGRLQASFLANKSTCPPIAEEFEAVIKEHPKSIYVPWCYYVLGRASQHQKRVPERARAVEASEYFRRLLEKHPKFPLTTEVRYEIARELLRLGQRDDALRRIDDLAGKHSDFLVFRNANSALEYLRDNEREITAEQLPPHYPQ